MSKRTLTTEPLYKYKFMFIHDLYTTSLHPEERTFVDFLKNHENQTLKTNVLLDEGSVIKVDNTSLRKFTVTAKTYNILEDTVYLTVKFS